jgi:hypothetical protein
MSVGFQTRPLFLNWLLHSSLVFVDEAAEDRPTLDPLLGKSRDRVIGGMGGVGGCGGVPLGY